MDDVYGRRQKPTEGAKLSGVSQETEPYADTTLESSLNGRRRCTDFIILISQASGQRKLIAHYDSNLSYIFVFFPEYIYILWFFYLLKEKEKGF